MVAGDYKPAAVVKSQLMKLNGSHLSYVLECFRKNTTKVKNVKGYLLSSLYNAPLTMGAYFTALVNDDMAEGVDLMPANISLSGLEVSLVNILTMFGLELVITKKHKIA